MQAPEFSILALLQQANEYIRKGKFSQLGVREIIRRAKLIASRNLT